MSNTSVIQAKQNHTKLKNLCAATACFLLAAPVYAAGFGQRIADKIDDINVELKIIAGSLAVLALIILGLLNFFGVDHNFKSKILSFVVACVIIAFAKEIVSFFMG